jgi:RNA polymerase sigma-70 factor (family 1)
MDPGRQENQIIRGIQSGDESAFRQLFESYYQKLVVFAGKYLGDLESARDVVQEFLTDLYESHGSISIRTSLKAYLYSSVRNRCLNQLKHRAVRDKHRELVMQPDITADPDQDFTEKMDATELEARISEIVSRLPQQCRRIFILSRVDEKKNREIAKELGLSVRTVETQISRALKALRDNLLTEGD